MAEVVVLGSFMMDLVIRAPRRPVAGETLVGHSLEQLLGGKGCNQAFAAARAGAATAMVGRLGADDHGEQFLAALARDRIDASGVIVDVDHGTGIGVPLVEDSGDNSIVIIPRANLQVTPADVAAAASTIAAAKVLLLQLELPVATSAAAARCAKEAGGFVVLNPAPAAPDLRAFRGVVDLLVPNEGEAALLTGLDDPLAAAKELQRELACPVVVTLGAEGSLLLHGDGAHERLAAHAVEVVDTVGAGDAFCGNLGARLASGATLSDAARWASVAASLSVTRPGAEPAMPWAADVEAVLAGHA